MTKLSTHQEDMTILNVTLSKTVSKSVQQKLTKLKEEIGKSEIKVWRLQGSSLSNRWTDQVVRKSVKI